MTIIIYFLLMFFAATMSFLFSGIEAGVFSLNRLRVRQQMREGQKNAKILFNYYREPEKFYWTITAWLALAEKRRYSVEKRF